MSKSLLIMWWQNRADKLAKKSTINGENGPRGAQNGPKLAKKGGNEYLGSKMNMREFLYAIFCSSCRGKIESTNWLKKVPSMENLA